MTKFHRNVALSDRELAAMSTALSQYREVLQMRVEEGRKGAVQDDTTIDEQLLELGTVDTLLNYIKGVQKNARS